MGVDLDLDTQIKDFDVFGGIDLGKNIESDHISGIDFVPQGHLLRVEEYRQMQVYNSLITDGIVINTGKIFVIPF